MIDFYPLIRPFLFSLQPEIAHNITLSFIKNPSLLSFLKIKNAYDPKFKRSVAGLEFPNPVGLAAGLDKNAEVFNEMGDLGFGFVEIGTVTPKPQAGNPKPRLFRLTSDKALINRMGFNNDGVEAVAQRLEHRTTKAIIGGNIGKNKMTPNENAVDDYLFCFKRLFDLVDYFTINVSSPNTPGLRDLQQKETLLPILERIQNENSKHNKSKPVFLKIAPDIDKKLVDDIIELIEELNISGIIATNTTISRRGLKTGQDRITKIGPGGLSGQPLKEQSSLIIQYIYSKTHKIPIIASGGIMTATDAQEKLNSGAQLIQLYTGFIYKGPQLINNCLKNITFVT